MLVLRPGALGDTLLALPALRALRRRFGRVTLAAHAGAGKLLEQCAEVDHGMPFDDPSLAWIFRGEPAPQPTIAWMSTPVGGALVNAPSRPTERVHCAEYLLRTLAPLGCASQLDTPPLRIRALSSKEVLVHPGSGSRAKNWPPERFASVIRGLHAPARLIVGEADTDAAARVERAFGQPLARLECDLPELAARLAGCLAYLGNDSGVSHLAGLCGARTIVMFGPTDPQVWRPLGPGVRVLPFESSTDDVLRALGA